MPLPPEFLTGPFPPDFLRSLEACLEEGQPGRFLAAVRSDPLLACEALVRLASKGLSVTGLPLDELFQRTGLNPSDRRGRRLDAALAELRAVGFLDALGFTSVTPLAPDDTRPRADFTAERLGQRWAVDARCASRDLLPDGSFLRPPGGGELPHPTLFDYLIHCHKEKAPQLSRTMADEGCARSAVLVAVDGPAGGDVMRSEALKAWLALGSPPEFRFGVMHALLSAEGSEDSLVPAP